MKLGVLLAVLLSLIVSVSNSEDSAVVQAARKERERRAKLKTGRVFTNKDVQEFAAKHPTPVKEGMEPEMQPVEETESDEIEDVNKELAESEAYWRKRYKEVARRVQASEKDVAEIQREVDDLTRAFYALNDVEQRGVIQYQRTQRINDLQQTKRELEDARIALDDLEEEARKAGALPGWLREE